MHPALLLCCLAGEEPPPRALASSEVGVLVSSLERLDAACRFRLELRQISLSWEDPLTDTPEFELLRGAARSGADGTATPLFAELDEAFQRLDAAVATRGSPDERWAFGAWIVSTPELQLEETRDPLDARGSAVLKSSRFSLIYENYAGADHGLRIEPAGASPYVYDVPMLLRPIPLDAASLDWWRRYVWEERGAGAGVRAFELHHAEEQPWRYRLELDPVTGQPLAASFHVSPAAPEARSMALFRYAPIAAESAQVWLRDVLAWTGGQSRAGLERFSLSEVSFDVGEEARRLDALEGTTLVDQRGGTPVFLGSDPARWPAEVASLVRLHPGMTPPAHDPHGHDEPPPAPAASRLGLRALGLCLLIGGGLCALRRTAGGRAP